MQAIRTRDRDGSPARGYGAIVGRTCAIATALPDAQLVVDATGVGRPVVDALRQRGLRLTPVIITSGSSARTVDGIVRLPNGMLVRKLCAAIESGSLRVAARE